MTKQGPSDYDLIDSPEDEPIVLVGQPDAVQGELFVRNPGERKVVVRDAQVRSEALKTAPAAPLRYTLSPIAVRPGLRRRVPLALAIDPDTPPGEYHGEVEVGGRVRPVVLHITEKVELVISPEVVVVHNLPGATTVKRVVFSNHGNVPLTLGEIGAVPLDDELWQCRTFRAALGALGEEIKSLETYALEIARQAKAVVERAGLLRVHNTAGTVVLEPGEVRPIDLEIRVPRTLEKRSRYRGIAPLYTTSLQFAVVPSPGEEAPTKAREREQ